MEATESLGALAVGVAALAITLVIAFLVLSEGESQADGLVESATTGESTTWSNESYTALVHSAHSLDTIVCNNVHNASAAGALVASGNYTCDANGIIFDGMVDTTGWSATMYVNYTYREPSYAINSTRSLATATDDVPGWVPLIIIVVVGGILLSLVAAFRRNS